MKLGSNDVQTFYSGTDEVLKIMLGTELVWTAYAPITTSILYNSSNIAQEFKNPITYYATRNYPNEK